MAPEKLLEIRRGKYEEALHRGHLVVVSSDGRSLKSLGDGGKTLIMRSTAKPFQLMTVVASGAAERFGLGDAELAVAASSHSAEPEHISLVRSILDKISMSVEDLRCGVHPPFQQHVVESMAKAGISPSAIHNNCSGKHAAMLAACLASGWPTERYEEADHPLQMENLQRIAMFAGLEVSGIGCVVDGCSVPTYALPMWNVALAYARVAGSEWAPQTEQSVAERVFGIMSSHPTIGSGAVDRLDAALMRAGEGLLIAKVGAEGVYAVGIAPGVVCEQGAGMVLKLEEGINFNRATGPIVITALAQLGVLDNKAVKELADFAGGEMKNCGGKVVGEMRILFDISN